MCAFFIPFNFSFVLFDRCNRTFASSAPSVASTQIALQFQVSKEVSYLVTTTFLLGYVFGVRTVFFLHLKG
jgi:hypothetical protein